MATFRRTKDGEWAVQGTTSEVKIGKVKVDRKDGSTRVVDVESIGRPFNRDGVQMVYGYLKGHKEAETTPAPAPQPVPESAQEALPLPETTYPSEPYVASDDHSSPEDCPF